MTLFMFFLLLSKKRDTTLIDFSPLSITICSAPHLLMGLNRLMVMGSLYISSLHYTP
jgi:hypothetical protein